MANKGRTTQYPYTLGDTLTIATTHMQNYRLDMEVYPDVDNQVWYSLTNAGQGNNGLYSSREGDAQNQYYIYNRGNITYTGMGHSSNPTDDELRLFINTMVASYRPTPDPPFLKVTKFDEEKVEVQPNGVYIHYAQLNDNFGDDVVVSMMLDSDSITTKYNQMSCEACFCNEDGEETGAYWTVVENATYTFTASKSDILSGNATYYVKLKTTYTERGQQKVTYSIMTVQIVPLPLFNLN